MQQMIRSFADVLLKAKGRDPCRMYEGDEELFADPPEREECIVCCLPLPTEASETMYQVRSTSFHRALLLKLVLQQFISSSPLCRHVAVSRAANVVLSFDQTILNTLSLFSQGRIFATAAFTKSMKGQVTVRVHSAEPRQLLSEKVNRRR